MNFSNRSAFSSAPANALTRSLEHCRASGQTVLDLTEANPTRAGFTYPGPSILGPLSSNDNLLYEPDAAGLLEARAAVSRYYAALGAAIPPERIFLTAGTSQAYAAIFQVLADPGAVMMSVKPGYPLCDVLASLSDIRLASAPARFVPGRGWAFDSEAAARAWMQDARALLLVHPSNPAGVYLNAQELDRASALAASKDAALIVDEVFFDFDWTGTRRVTSAGRKDVLTFTLNGLSKMAGLPQMKLAWIAVSGPEELARDAGLRLEHVLDAFLSVSTPAQRALGPWLSERAVMTGEILARVKENHTRLVETLSGTALEPYPAEGGWYAVLGLPSGVSDEDAALGLLKDHGVLTHPGYFFDLPVEGLVVSLLPESSVFTAALERMAVFAGSFR